MNLCTILCGNKLSIGVMVSEAYTWLTR